MRVTTILGCEEAKRVAARTLGVMASQADWHNGGYTIGVDIRRDSEAEVVKLTLSIASEKRLDPKERGA